MSDEEIVELHFAIIGLPGPRYLRAKIGRDPRRALAIVDATAGALRTNVRVIRSRALTQHVAAARQICMYILRTITALPFPVIGEFFDRDHSTVMHACNQVSHRAATDEPFRLMLLRIQRRVELACPKPQAEAPATSETRAA